MTLWHSCITGKGELAFNVSPTDDVGLSAKQMQQYEARLETLTMKNHFLETQLQHIKTTGMTPPPATPGCDYFDNPDYSVPGMVLPPPNFLGPYSYCPPAPPGMENYGVPMDPLNGAPSVQALPPPKMSPQKCVNVEGREEPAINSPQITPPLPPLSQLPQTEDDVVYNKVPPYVPPPRFRNRQEAIPHASSSAPDAGRQKFGSSGRYKNDGRYGRGRSATELSSTSGTGWRRTDRTTTQQSHWRMPSH